MQQTTAADNIFQIHLFLTQNWTIADTNTDAVVVAVTLLILYTGKLAKNFWVYILEYKK